MGLRGSDQFAPFPEMAKGMVRRELAVTIPLPTLEDTETPPFSSNFRFTTIRSPSPGSLAHPAPFQLRPGANTLSFRYSRTSRRRGQLPCPGFCQRHV